MKFILPIFIAVGFLIAPEVRAQLNIAEPPEGELSRDQLESIAIDINSLLEQPLGEGAEEARGMLWEWIKRSPDITVTVCPTVIGPVAQLDNPHKTMYVILSVLSSAEHLIVNPEADLLDEQVNGIAGMLQAYEAATNEIGDEARDTLMDTLVQIRNEGNLRNAVSNAIGDCRRAK